MDIPRLRLSPPPGFAAIVPDHGTTPWPGLPAPRDAFVDGPPLAWSLGEPPADDMFRPPGPVDDRPALPPMAGAHGNRRAMELMRGALSNFRNHRPAALKLLRSVTTAIGLCGRDWQAALRCLDQLGRSWNPLHPYPVRPNVIAFNAAMVACARGRRLDQVLRLLDRMMAAGLAPDDVSFRIILMACRDKGEIGLALALFERLLQTAVALGFYPDVRTHNIVLSACQRFGLAEEALRIFHRMVRQGPAYGVMPDTINYTTVMSACIKARRPEDALWVFVHMLEEGRAWGAVPDTVTYNAVLAACRDVGCADLALRVLAHLREHGPRHGFHPDPQSYKLAMQCCAKARRAGDAIDLFLELRAESTTDTSWAEAEPFVA